MRTKFTKFVSMLAVAAMLATGISPVYAAEVSTSSETDAEIENTAETSDEEETTEQTGIEYAVLALGEDLTQDQRTTVLTAMGLTEEQAADITTIYITNSMEHEYLDDTMGSSVVGSKALSSVLIIPQEEGTGLTVETHNISYCTETMYCNALLTAGVSDAAVIVAAPFSVSGTAALIGAVKAYEEYSGEEVAEEALETATEELVLTGELADAIEGVDSEAISELIAWLKQQVAQMDETDEENLEALIESGAEQMGITLTDEQIDQILELLKKLSELDIDVDSLISQAQDLYSKIEAMDIQIDVEKAENFLVKFIKALGSFFQTLFGSGE